MERSERSLQDRCCSNSRLTRRGGGRSLLAIRVGRPAIGQVPRSMILMMLLLLDVGLGLEDSAM